MLVAVSTVQNSCEKPSSRQCPCWYTSFPPHSLMLKTAPLSSSIFEPFLVGCSSFPPQSSPVCCVVCLSWWWLGGHSVFYALSLWWPSVGLWYNFPPFGWTLPMPFLYVMYVNEFWVAICLSFLAGSSSVVCLSLPSTFCHIPTVGFLSFPQASLQRIWPFGRVYNAYGVVVSMEHKQCGIILRIAEHEIAIQWFIQYVYSSTFVLESSSFSTFKSTLEKQFTLVLHEISSMDLCQEGLHEDLAPELASETVS